MTSWRHRQQTRGNVKTKPLVYLSSTRIQLDWLQNDILTLYDVIMAKNTKELETIAVPWSFSQRLFFALASHAETLSFPSSNQSDTSILQIINYNGKHVLYLGRQVGRDLHSMMDYLLFFGSLILKRDRSNASRLWLSKVQTRVDFSMSICHMVIPPSKNWKVSKFSFKYQN